MPVTFDVQVRWADGKQRRGKATFAAEVVSAVAGERHIALRYADLTRIMFDGRWLRLADTRGEVTLQVLRRWPRTSRRRTEALARVLQPLAGRPGAQLAEEALADLS
ncbi:MAG: hypothetical protein HY320_10650 [Armatimonadetes bacterium]|nr:hypothetical protein [Armatimonadota bacterium]